MNRPAIEEMLAEAFAFTIVAVALIVVLAVGFGIFIVSGHFFGDLLSPYVPNGWPSLLIVLIAALPAIFYAGLVGAAFNRLADEESRDA